MANDLVAFKERFEADAAQYAEQEPLGGGRFVSTKGGMFVYGDEKPSDQYCVIVLHSVYENTFYREKWTEDNPAAPSCYAFGDLPTDMGPHPSMQNDMEYFYPEHSQCTGCPQNVFGTADTGKGKACQNRRRLAFIPAGVYTPRPRSKDFDLDLYTEPSHFETADIAMVKVSPTSTKNWAAYVQAVKAQFNYPPYAVITRMYLEKHVKNQFALKFDLIDKIPDDLAAIIIARHEEAAANIVTPYTRPQERDAAPAGGALRGLRR